LVAAARGGEVTRHVGRGSFDGNLEGVRGVAPTTARDRMRVAVALESLPAVRAALTAGDVTFSAVRELTRVATADTEQAWLDAIANLTAREVEQCVRGHKPGDHPDDRPDPQLEPRAVRMQLLPESYALFLEARRALEAEVGHPMSDSDFMAVACRDVLTGGHAAGGDEASGGSDDRPLAPNTPPYQIALTVCVDCQRATLDAAGHTIDVPPAIVDCAQCDAVVLGRVDGPAPEPTQRTIPAPVRRLVLARDHHRCVVPGCRSSRFIDVHHLRPRAAGGDHQPLNLACLCSSHHVLLHAGAIVIRGVPGDLRVTHADGRAYGAAPPGSARTHVGEPSLGVRANASVPARW